VSEATQIVAIDGPAGAGKSSAAREAARRLGFRFLDTGAMYRAATWRALRDGVSPNNKPALIASTRAMKLDMVEEPGGLRVLVDGEDVTDAIRTPEITRQIKLLDQIPDVRAHLVELQRHFGEGGPTVAEGRDIGTVVFPKARCKIFLDASPEERARRRAEQLTAKGVPFDLEELKQEIRDRDEASRKRRIAPLRQAEDAVLLDTTELDFEQVVQRLVAIAREKLCL
jgi:cytidylate kinase